MPAVAMVTAIWARQIVEKLEQDGIDTADLLHETGLERRRLFRPEARIPYPKHVAMFDRAAELTGDDCFGLVFGGSCDTREIGLVGYMGLTAPTLGKALVNIKHYLHVMSEGISASFEPAGDHVVVSGDTVEPRFRTSRQLFEYGNAQFVQWCRVLTGHRITPLWVDFRHQRTENIPAFRQYFGCPVHFGRLRPAIAVKMEDMARPLATADDRLHRLLQTYCEEILARRASVAALAQEVERAVAAHLPAGRADLHTVAAELGMSKRTLSRRLAEEDTSFAEIRERLRQDLAIRYLSDPALTMTQIAYLLGYSEVSAFNHAFRRWTGATPTLYRNRAA